MMKIAAAVCLVFAVVLVYAERCQYKQDCKITLCSNGSSIICERHECTCRQDARQCVTRQDCLNGASCPFRGQDWHCVDNVCRCTY